MAGVNAAAGEVGSAGTANTTDPEEGNPLASSGFDGKARYKEYKSSDKDDGSQAPSTAEARGQNRGTVGDGNLTGAMNPEYDSRDWSKPKTDEDEKQANGTGGGAAPAPSDETSSTGSSMLSSALKYDSDIDTDVAGSKYGNSSSKGTSEVTGKVNRDQKY